MRVQQCHTARRGNSNQLFGLCLPEDSLATLQRLLTQFAKLYLGFAAIQIDQQSKLRLFPFRALRTHVNVLAELVTFLIPAQASCVLRNEKSKERQDQVVHFTCSIGAIHQTLWRGSRPQT